MSFLFHNVDEIHAKFVKYIMMMMTSRKHGLVVIVTTVDAGSIIGVLESQALERSFSVAFTKYM